MSSNTERSRKFRAKLNDDPLKKENFLKARRAANKINYDCRKNNLQFKRKNVERVQNCRLRKKQGLAVVQPVAEDGERGSFKANSSFSKALKRAAESLPKDADKQKTVVQKLYFNHFPNEKPKRTHVCPPQEVNQTVTEFYLRDDISQQLPGQKDTKIIRGADGSKTYVQKRVMLMTLTEAFAEFKNFHPEASIAKTKFCTLKPPHVDLVGQMKQVGCLCKKCENMKMLFAALKPKMNKDVKTVEEMMEYVACKEICNGSCNVCSDTFEFLLQDLFESDELDDEITLVQWLQDVYQLKMKTEIKDLNYCINLFVQTFLDYKRHIFVKKSQSSLFYEARSTSSPETAVIQVDFAENFKCLSQNEVQSAYFNQHAIAIFTVVIWAGEKTFSKVYVTDDTSHSKYCVLAFLFEILSEMKDKLPTLKEVIMFSDGCAAQFKNRWILSLVLKANELFGISLKWNFFASGHGKGAVDGIGGTVKRSVYQRIMSGKVQVYSAEEFHNCLSQNVSGISSTFVAVDRIKNFETSFADKWKRIKAIPGVTKFFSFQKSTDKIIEAREVGSSANVKKFKLLV